MATKSVRESDKVTEVCLESGEVRELSRQEFEIREAYRAVDPADRPLADRAIFAIVKGRFPYTLEQVQSWDRDTWRTRLAELPA